MKIIFWFDEGLLNMSTFHPVLEFRQNPRSPARILNQNRMPVLHSALLAIYGKPRNKIKRENPHLSSTMEVNGGVQ